MYPPWMPWSIAADFVAEVDRAIGQEYIAVTYTGRVYEINFYRTGVLL
jgi:hypothetical protein